MRTAARLGLYGAGLALAFGSAFAAAGAVVPESTVADWAEAARGHQGMGAGSGHESEDEHGGHGVPTTAKDAERGVSSALGDFQLSPVKTPREVGQAGTLSFEVVAHDGEAYTEFATSHEKDLHLIVVRTDGAQFRHVHPSMDAQGTWSLPWTWARAGTYRVYADFVPSGDDATAPMTLTRTVEVAGSLRPVNLTPRSTTTVDGFDVELTGELAAGASSHLGFTVTRDGAPVEELQPYLGAFGHLVALREGDLAYLHVHPKGEEPLAGSLSGPTVEFVAQTPSSGRYLLYLDFRVAGSVHTANFVVDSGRAADTTANGEHTRSGHGSESGDKTSDASETGSVNRHGH